MRSVLHIKNSLKSDNYRKAIIKPSIPLVISTGPAGTGKSYQACKFATELMRNEPNKYKHLYITRPFVPVEGENLGFLPGTLEEKMNPWVSHLLSFCYHIPMRNVQMTTLGHMRGITYEDSIIIADEMQNSTPHQMKTLLTRIGENTKVIITGDVTQCDLTEVELDGLSDLIQKLDPDSSMTTHIEFTNDDVRRSEFVKYILQLYQSSGTGKDKVSND